MRIPAYGSPDAPRDEAIGLAETRSETLSIRWIEAIGRTNLDPSHHDRSGADGVAMARLGYLEVFVRNFFNVAVFSLSSGIGIVIGCSAPSPDGTGLSRGRGSSSGSNGDDEPNATQTPASCENHEPVDDRPACDLCVRTNCCEQVLECDNTADCQAMMLCLEECGPEDLACGLTCQIAHERGGSVLSEVAACAQTKCKAECPSQALGDAGLDLDAF